MDDRLQENGTHESTAKLFAHGSGQATPFGPWGFAPPPGTTPHQIANSHSV